MEGELQLSNINIRDYILKNNTLECRWIGKRFAELVSNDSSPMRGELVSVFDSAANIKTHHNHLLVITKNAVRSPIALNILQEGDNQSFRKYMKFGSAIWGDGVKLIVEDEDGGSIVIGLRKSKLFKNRLEPLTKRSLSKFCDIHESIFHSLMKLVRPGCLLQPDITTEGLLSEQLSSIASIGNKIDNDSEFATFMANILDKPCGRGPGYTPAGDDYITGFLAMFNWCAKCLDFNRIELPTYYAELTSWTSYKLMEYGKECHCDEEMQGIINSVARGSANEYFTNMGPISHRGHTSGIDLVTGITCALYTIIDRIFGTNSLREFDSFLKKKRETKNRGGQIARQY
jgi:hypothetical protein